MSLMRSIIGVGAALGVLAGPVAAQDQDRAVSIFARSGGFNALTDVDEAGTADFKKTGFNVGGGVAVDLSRHVALRGDFTFARNELRAGGVDTGSELDRYFYDAALQLQYPTAAGLTPYAFAGAGGVTLQEADAEDESQTELAGTFGLGVNYTIPGTGFGIFVEGQSWLFDGEDLEGALAAYDRTQYELAWTGGISYRLPY